MHTLKSNHNLGRNLTEFELLLKHLSNQFKNIISVLYIFFISPEKLIVYIYQKAWELYCGHQTSPKQWQEI